MPFDSSIPYLIMGAFFGLSAGISPGPLLTLVISETLRHNRKEGIKVAVAPLITDLPIILLTSLILSRLSQYSLVLAFISLSGGIYFSWLGYETIKTKELDVDIKKKKSDTVRKGITANFLNPNPYIFWLTAGIPNAFKAYERSLIAVILYFLLFYVMLIGSKIIVALLVERSKDFLRKNTYRIIMLILGTALLGFAVWFFYEGIKIFAGR